MSQKNQNRPKVFVTLVKDDDNVVQLLWINSTHQGALLEVAGWLRPRLKKKLEDNTGDIKYYQVCYGEKPSNHHLAEQIEVCQKFGTGLQEVQRLLAQEKLEEAVAAYNDLEDYYYIQMGEEEVGS